MDTKPKVESEKDDVEDKGSVTKDPRMNDLRRREKWLDVYDKVNIVKEKRRKADLDALEQSLDIAVLEKQLERMEDPNVFNLFMATQLTTIDEDSTQIGSEVKYKNLFDESELSSIKSEILDILLKRKKKRDE